MFNNPIGSRVSSEQQNCREVFARNFYNNQISRIAEARK